MPDAVVRRLPGRLGAARIGERRLKELGRQVRRARRSSAFIAEWLDYSERRDGRGDRASCPAAALTASAARTTRSRALPEGVAGQGRGRASIPAQARIEVDLRDNIDCLAVGLNLSRDCAHGRRDDRRLQLPAGRRAAQRRQLPPHRVLLREGCAVGGPVFPLLGLGGDHEPPQPADQPGPGRVRQLGDGHGLAEGGGRDRRRLRGRLGHRPAGAARTSTSSSSATTAARARPTADGWITYAMPDCAKTIYIDSFEVLEQKYPMRFRGLRLLTDSGGPGRHRGGSRERDGLRPDPMLDAGLLLRRLRRSPAAGRGRRRAAGGAAPLSKLERRRQPRPRSTRSATSRWSRASGPRPRGRGRRLRRPAGRATLDAVAADVARAGSRSRRRVTTTAS